MVDTFGAGILIQAPDPQAAAAFYVEQLGFTITARDPMIALQGSRINLSIEQGSQLGPVLEVTVVNLDEATRRLVEHACEVVRDEPEFPRRYVNRPLSDSFIT
jgi:Glyoxalase-like domain